MKVFAAFFLAFFSSPVWAMSPAPPPGPRPSVAPSPAPTPTPTANPSAAPGAMAPSFYAQSSPQGFALPALDGVDFSPDCLRKAGVELLVIDPGHDDSAASRRSDSKVRGGGSSTQFLWPKIHEGNLTQVTSWIVYDLILKSPRLTERERKELQTMIRFSRHPGEKAFAQYEKELGYYASTQGAIDDTITNRKARVDYMIKHHRSYVDGTAAYWSGAQKDVSSKAIMLSVHANSSDYFDEGDLSWAIPPKGTSQSSATFSLVKNLVTGLSREFGTYFEPGSRDSTAVRDLKRDVSASVLAASIKTDEHPLNLAMLSPSIGNSLTRKILIEGFVMNGKAGHLANLDITGASPKKLVFRHGGATVFTYDVADLYIAYAKSIVRGLNEAMGCSR